MQMWSLNKNTSPYIGRAYFKTSRTSIFLIKILDECIWHSDDAHDAYNLFLEQIVRIEFHEFIHIFFKHTLGKWACSEKTKILPLEDLMTKPLAEVLAKGYAEIFFDVYVWLMDKVKWV